MKFKPLTSDHILSISAIVIALASICVTLWKGSEIRKHNRLSVLPKIQIAYSTSAESF
jgi:hypothetical protein